MLFLFSWIFCESFYKNVVKYYPRISSMYSTYFNKYEEKNDMPCQNNRSNYANILEFGVNIAEEPLFCTKIFIKAVQDAEKMSNKIHWPRIIPYNMETRNGLK